MFHPSQLTCQAKYEIRIFFVPAGARMQPRPRGLFVFQYDGGCHTGKREDSGDELGEDLPPSAPLRSLPPINNSPLKNLNRLNQSREVKLTKQYNSRVLFFLPSCVGAAVLNLANKSVQKVSQHNKILIAAANVLTFNEFKIT